MSSLIDEIIYSNFREVFAYLGTAFTRYPHVVLARILKISIVPRIDGIGPHDTISIRE